MALWQVRAFTLPLLRFGVGNMEENQLVVQFHVVNGGTGPALVSWLRILWNGAPVKGPQDLLDKCCAKRPARRNEVLRGHHLGQYRARRPDPEHLVDGERPRMTRSFGRHSVTSATKSLLKRASAPSSKSAGRRVSTTLHRSG